MLGRHSYVESIVFFTCAITYSMLSIESQYVYQFVSKSYNFSSNNSLQYCTDIEEDIRNDRSQIVADEVSRWTQIAGVLKAVANTISVLVLTSWSEKIGRRNALLFPVVGAMVCSTLQLIIIYFRLSLLVFVINSFIFGATGSWVALINISTAYVCDTVTKDQRGQRYTIVELSAAIGGGLSQIGTGYWVNNYGFIPASIFISCCSVVPFILTIFLRLRINMNDVKQDKTAAENEEKQFKKSVSDETEAKKRSTFSGVSMMLAQLREVFRIYTSNVIKCDICDQKNIDCVHCDGKGKKRVWRLWFLLVTYVVYMAAVEGISLFMTMFLVSYPICFTPDLIGWRSGLNSAAMILSPLVIKLYVSVLNFGNQTILISAILGRIIFSFMMFIAKGSVLVFAGTAFSVFSHLTTPFIRVQISNLVSPMEQGAALALVPSVAKLITIISPIVILTIYPETLHTSHSFIWIVMASFFLIPFFLMTVVWIADKRNGLKWSQTDQ